MFAVPSGWRVWQCRAGADERLLIYLLAACGLWYLHYCFYDGWWGAITYGSRFLIDILPVLCYLLVYFLAHYWQRPTSAKPKQGLLAVFLACVVFSTSVQVVGAFSDIAIWDTIPSPSYNRLWDWQDTQITRHAKNLWWKLDPPEALQRPRVYLQQMGGAIEQITEQIIDEQEQPLPTPLTVKPSQTLMLKAQVKNTGQFAWFGYQSGLRRGLITVKVQFLDATGQSVKVLVD